MKRAWALMAILSLGVAAYALVILAVPAFRPPFLRSPTTPLAVLLHFGGGGVALATGPFQFLASWRARRLTLHRWMGRVYVASILAGGTAALLMATRAQAGPVAQAGFGLLAVLWLGTTVAAYLTIRAGDRRAHERMMIRSFALTLAAVTLRVYLPASLASGLSFEAAYRVIAWACWVPNLIVAEWLFVPRAEVRKPGHAPALAR